MPHQCVHCSRFIPVGSRELLEGCENCGSKFFFYIKEEYVEKIKNSPVEIPQGDKKNIEKDIRDMAGIKDEEAPVVLDIEAVRAIGQGKYEIDVAKLFRKNSPLIYKLEEGKYIIDLSSTLSKDIKENIEKDNFNK